MKQTIKFTLSAFLMLLGPAFAMSAWAGTTVQSTVSASVDAALELNFIMYRSDGTVTQGPFSSAMNFGTLVQDQPGAALRSQYYFHVVLTPNSSSRPFMITQTAAAPSNGTVTVPAGACVVTPWPTDANGRNYPSGSLVGSRGSFVATDKLIYRSGSSGKTCQVAASYAIANTPQAGATEFVTPYQAGGEYTTVLTFQLSLLS